MESYTFGVGPWVCFFVLMFILLGLDIFLYSGRQKAHRISSQEALFWTLIWFLISLIFSGFLWLYLTKFSGVIVANQKFLEFFTGYLIEKSLSVDNIFVFLLIFSYFVIPLKYQRRILLYGVLGAIVMRFIMISGGIWLMDKFHWIFYIFGAFLIFSAIKMLIASEEDESDFSKNFLLRMLRKYLPVTQQFHGEKFFVLIDARWHVTPLFVALILIEISDLIFAVDSIPAIFAITRDPFIVFTSNIFAIMGLRALYFLVADVADRLEYLKFGLAIILCFVGVKMLISEWVEIPVLYTLGFVISVLVISILTSLYLKKDVKKQ